MAHYFDDVFTRNAREPRNRRSRPNMRRSSTARSIGARSDFDASVNGDHDGAHDPDHDDGRSQSNSVAPETEERTREREEADAHTANYVSEQLSLVRSHQLGDFERGDEYEAQLDGQ